MHLDFKLGIPEPLAEIALRALQLRLERVGSLLETDGLLPPAIDVAPVDQAREGAIESFEG